jgi:hypothetical protein
MLPNMAYANAEYASTQSVEAQWPNWHIPQPNPCFVCAGIVATCLAETGGNVPAAILCAVAAGRSDCSKCF